MSYIFTLFLERVGINSSGILLETIPQSVNGSVRQLQELCTLFDKVGKSVDYHMIKLK